MSPHAMRSTTKAATPNATPFFCLTKVKQRTKIASEMRNLFLASGWDNMNQTATQYRALSAAPTPRIRSWTETGLSLLNELSLNTLQLPTGYGAVFKAELHSAYTASA